MGSKLVKIRFHHEACDVGSLPHSPPPLHVAKLPCEQTHEQGFRLSKTASHLLRTLQTKGKPSDSIKDIRIHCRIFKQRLPSPEPWHPNANSRSCPSPRGVCGAVATPPSHRLNQTTTPPRSRSLIRAIASVCREPSRILRILQLAELTPRHLQRELERRRSSNALQLCYCQHRHT